jgi:hypothetical protein
MTGGSTTGGNLASTGGNSPSPGGNSGTGGKAGSGSGGKSGGSTGGTGTAGTTTGGTATGGSGGASAGGAGTTPPPVPCSTTLAERVKITAIPVTPKVVTKGSGINSVSLPVILATSPNGRAKAAWSDGTNVHVTPLDEGNQRAGADVTVMGSEVRGFVAHDDGSALLVRRGDAMVFERLDEAGTVKATLGIVGGNTHMTEGNRWIDDWPHQGRLAWSGTQYAAYFGQTGNHGSAGNHQGDHYTLITSAGALDKGGWDWGCSHSLDDRIAHNGTSWAPICISDTYPGAGIFHSNRTKVSDEPSVTNVGGVAKLGGLVPTSDGFFLSFTSPEGRSAPDVAFVKVGNDGKPSGKVWVTDTPSVSEGYSHLAAYGDKLLAGWDAGTTFTVAVLDKAGAVVEGPAATTAKLGGQDDIVTFANGDVGWAAAWEDLTQLKIVRVLGCK